MENYQEMNRDELWNLFLQEKQSQINEKKSQNMLPLGMLGMILGLGFSFLYSFFLFGFNLQDTLRFFRMVITTDYLRPLGVSTLLWIGGCIFLGVKYTIEIGSQIRMKKLFQAFLRQKGVR